MSKPTYGLDALALALAAVLAAAIVFFLPRSCHRCRL